MSKKKQTEAEKVKEEKAAEASEETIKEEEKTAPEPVEKPAEEKAENTEEAKPKTDELAAEKDKYLRLCAEYDNFRKRSQKEKDAIYTDVRAITLISFLPVYDNLLRAINQPTEDEAYKKGVEMIRAQFKATMEKLGVTEMDCLGQKFDPAFHNAVMHVDDEEKGENEIVEVFQQGFMLGDKVIRFAMVKVAN